MAGLAPRGRGLTDQGVVRLGLLGGTFDPPHNAHIALAEAARAQLHLDRIVFVPAGDPWRKRDREVSPAPARLAMLQAAIDPFPWATVSEIELERDGPSYTAETLEALVQPGEHWWFILGADALQDMADWYEPGRIVALARLAVAQRPGAPPPRPDARLRALAPGIEERLDVVPMEPMAISSTEVRRRIRAGESTEGLIAPAVRQVADALRLYRA